MSRAADATLSRSELTEHCRRAGLAGRSVLVHSAFRSFAGQVASPDDIIEALLAAGATVMAPTFSYAMELPANAAAATGPVYDTASNQLSRADMGALPASLLERAGRVRGNHPLDSFTALGPDAAALIDAQDPVNVYPPLEYLCANGGAVVLMGVNLTSMTLLHLAEVRAGRQLFAARYHAGNGVSATCRVGGCSNGFAALDAALAPAEQRWQVGASLWRVLDAALALDLATAAIRTNPAITHCGQRCRRCDAALGR